MSLHEKDGTDPGLKKTASIALIIAALSATIASLFSTFLYHYYAFSIIYRSELLIVTVCLIIAYLYAFWAAFYVFAAESKKNVPALVFVTFILLVLLFLLCGLDILSVYFKWSLLLFVLFSVILSSFSKKSRTLHVPLGFVLLLVMAIVFVTQGLFWIGDVRIVNCELLPNADLALSRKLERVDFNYLRSLATFYEIDAEKSRGEMIEKLRERMLRLQHNYTLAVEFESEGSHALNIKIKPVVVNDVRVVDSQAQPKLIDVLMRDERKKIDWNLLIGEGETKGIIICYTTRAGLRGVELQLQKDQNGDWKISEPIRPLRFIELILFYFDIHKVLQSEKVPI